MTLNACGGKIATQIGELSIKAHWKSLRVSMVACFFETGVDRDDAMEVGSLIAKLLIIVTLVNTHSAQWASLTVNGTINHT